MNNSMYFITRKTSLTGEKFKKVSQLRDEAIDAQRAFCEKYKVDKFRGAVFYAWGGISSCVFSSDPDKKIWKKIPKRSGEYMPKKSSKVGKVIQVEIINLPKVNHQVINDCIGFDGELFTNIGFDESDDYFGFVAFDDWGVAPPDDCREVTFTEYKKLFIN